MQTKKIKLTREELYQQIWSKPTTMLAKEFGISDVMIAKICKKLKIPKPYPGYWRRAEVGHRVPPPPLPKAEPGIPKEIVIQPTLTKPPFESKDPEVLAQIETEKQPGNHIMIAKDLRKAHPLILQTQQAFKGVRPDSYSILRPNWNQPHLDIHVSKNNLRRALLIMDVLLKALEARGYAVEVSKKDSLGTHIIIRGQKVKVCLSERSNRREKDLTKEEREKPFVDRWIYTPTGKLVFSIDEHWDEIGRKRWSDKVQLPLEEQLNEVVVGIIIAAEGLRARELRFQEERRKWREAEIRRQIEVQRRKFLEDQTGLWIRAQNYRAFLQACEAAIIRDFGTITPDSSEACWLEWAKSYINRLDPLMKDNLKNMILEFSKITSFT